MKHPKWSPAEIRMLLNRTKTGSVRIRAFEWVAAKTGRRANSVRNFYYKLLSSGEGRADLRAHAKHIFKPFPTAEVRELLREIVLGTSRGESVRGICLRLANGSRTGMLRLQNKYRAVLGSTPDRIARTVKTLEGQGYLVKNPLSVGKIKAHGTADTRTPDNRKLKDSPPPRLPSNVIMLPERHTGRRLTDTDINNLFIGLVRLIKKQTHDEQVAGLNSQIEKLKAEITLLKNRNEVNKALK
jgi:hypothetical protein